MRQNERILTAENKRKQSSRREGLTAKTQGREEDSPQGKENTKFSQRDLNRFFALFASFAGNTIHFLCELGVFVGEIIKDKARSYLIYPFIYCVMASVLLFTWRTLYIFLTWLRTVSIETYNSAAMV